MKILINGVEARVDSTALTDPGCVRLTFRDVGKALALHGDGRVPMTIDLVDVGPIAAQYLVRLVPARTEVPRG